MSSKNFSMSPAVLESAPRSMSSAPRDTTPSTVFSKPDASPAPTDANIFVSLFFSAGINGVNSAKVYSYWL